MINCYVIFVVLVLREVSVLVGALNYCYYLLKVLKIGVHNVYRCMNTSKCITLYIAVPTCIGNMLHSQVSLFINYKPFLVPDAISMNFVELCKIN